MATQGLDDVKLWLDGADFSGDHNSLGLAYAAELLDDTVFGDDTRSRKGGLKTFAFDHQGFWNGGDDEIDDFYFTNVGVADVLMSWGPEGSTEGDPAYFGRMALADYNPGATVGEMFAFSVSGEASDTPVHGTILANVSGASSSAASTGQELGAVSSSQKLYAGIHVLSAGTGTLNAVVESDDTADFDGSETTRVTFSEFSAVGSEWGTPVDGQITDTFWRIDYTIAGGAPDFDFIVVLAIQ